MINDGREYFSTVYQGSGTKTDMTGFCSVFSTQGGIIVGMFFMSLTLAIGFLFLIKAFPEYVIYTMIGLMYLIFMVFVFLGLINQIWWMVA